MDEGREPLPLERYEVDGVMRRVLLPGNAHTRRITLSIPHALSNNAQWG